MSSAHLVDRGGDRIDDALDLVSSGREWRHQHDDVAERADEHAATHARRGHAPTPAQVVRWWRELDAGHQTATADLFDPGQRLDARCKTGSELLRTRLHVAEHVPLVDELEMALRDRGSER